MVFIAHGQAPKTLEPRIGAFDNPAMLVAAELPSILPRLAALRAVRHDQVDPPSVQSLPQRARVIATVGDEARRFHAGAARAVTAAARDVDLGERRFGEGDLGHRGSFHENSER